MTSRPAATAASRTAIRGVQPAAHAAPSTTTRPRAPRPEARGVQVFIELAFVARRRSRRGRRPAIRRSSTGAQAAHAAAAAAQESQHEGQGVASDDRDMGRRRQMGDRHHAIDQFGVRRVVGRDGRRRLDVRAFLFGL
jgi:hypothetical protein